MDNKKLNSLGFFYKGNGVTLFEPALSKMLKILDEYLFETDKVVKEDGIDGVFEQLDIIHQYINSEQKDTVEYKKYVNIFMMNVYYLTIRGYLTNDKDNGLLYSYMYLSPN